ncbi:Nocturnin [Blattella germanica]|nr:Nocturnin [Blattella germanica]
MCPCVLYFVRKGVIFLRRIYRMGSFTSAPKILNEDTQDMDVMMPAVRMSRDELLEHCHQQREGLPSLVKRNFRRLSQQFGDTTSGVRVLQWNVLSRVCGDAVSSPYHIRVLQWNVLSQSLGQMNDNFVCCPDDALEWRSRRYHIVEEIVSYCPDIICLQSVLATQGYKGMFFPKPDSPCLYIKGNNGPDGCAIFFREDKFELLKMETRILEGKDLLDFVTTQCGGRPVIVCGDFNAEPTEPVYLSVLGNSCLGLASAYAANGTDDPACDVTESIMREPPYTTWKIREEGEVCHTIDYVFYSEDKFAVEAVLDFPSGEDIGEGRVPSFSYPSDHFSLVCDFRFKNADGSHS